MKKITKILITSLLFTMLLTLVLAFAACGSEEKADKIVMENMPRLSYVSGQELDLSKGSLVVTEGEKTKSVPLTSSDVKISGYDKNATGAQTVTVEYKGQTCTFTVTVHARLEAVNYEADYLVGETFNTEKGKLLIYRDDGIASTSVRLNDDAVTVESAPFTQTGSVTLSATYQGETAKISVNVYEAESSRLYSPNKIEYKSHETELDLTGGYLVIKANNGKLVRQAVLSETMVTGGFDPSAATVEHIDAPLKQKVSVEYLGGQYSFEVRVRYSYVSLMRLRAGELANVDLNNVSAEQGQNAVAAVNGYFRLNEADRALLTGEEKLTVVRAATVYGKRAWNAFAEQCASTVAFGAEGGYTFVKDGTYENAQATYQAISSEFSALDALIAALNNIAGDSEFANAEITEGVSASEYIGNALNAGDLEKIKQQLDFMFELYEKFTTVPADWAQNANAVADTIALIANGNYKDSSRADMYHAVSAWCGRDMFGVFYAYCYREQNAELLKTVSNICLPQDFMPLYNDLAAAVSVLDGLTNYEVLDTTEFLWLYSKVLSASSELENSADPELKWLYGNMEFSFGENMLPFEGWIYYLAIADYGVYDSVRGSLEEKEFDVLWNSYLQIVDEIVNNNGAYSAENVEAFLREFVNAAPSAQYSFLASVNPHYNYFPHFNAIPEHALDHTNSFYSTVLTEIIFDTYLGENSALSDNSKAIFGDLMIALEDYALRFYGGAKNDGTKVDYLSEFLNTMAAAETKYQALTGDEKTAFDGKLGYFYTKYLSISQMYNADGSMKPIDLGEHKAKFDELAKVIGDISRGYELINSKIYVYGTFVAGYEHAGSLANEILAVNDETVKNAFYYGNFYGDMSLDVALYMLRETYVSALTGNDRWEEYRNSDLQQFMIAASPVMQMFVNYFFAEPSETVYGAENKEAVKNAIDTFYTLSAKDKVLFYGIDLTKAELSGETQSVFWYDEALNGYFKENLGAKAYAAQSALMEWEYCYTAYVYYGNTAEDLAALRTAVERFNTLYAALGDELGAFNEYFEGMYSYYQAAYEAIPVAE